MRERLLASDPKDALSQEKVAFIHRQLGSLYEENGDPALALKHYRFACDAFDAIPTRTPAGTIQAADSWRGIARLQGDDPAASCDAYRRAFDLFRSVNELDRRATADGNSDPLPNVARTVARCAHVP